MTLAQILASYWRSFVAIAGASFAALALAVIFLLPGPRVLVRSSIDVGSHFHLGSASAIYPPEVLVRRTLDVYVPSTLSTLSKEGASTRTLSALQSSIIEVSPPLSIVITSTVDASAGDTARKFQDGLATLILSGESSRVEALREAQAARVAAATSDKYDKQIGADRDQLDRINKRIAEIETSRHDQEAELTGLLQRQPSDGQGNEQAPAQARIRQLQDQLADQAGALTALLIQQNSFLLALGTMEGLAQIQAESAVEIRLEQKAFSEPRVSLPPTAALVTPQLRRSGLLAVAFVASLLIAFGIITAIHNVQASRRQG